MKKVLGLCISLLLLLSFPVYAQQQYEYNNLSFTVPEFLENDAEWAERANFIYAFCDADTKMEFNISVYNNEGYSYEGFDEEGLLDYAESLKLSFSEYVELSVEKFSLNSGFKGIYIKVDYTDGQKGRYYWFATDEYCYDLNFIFYDESYIIYEKQIINTVSIDGLPSFDPFSEEEEVTVPEFSDKESDNNHIDSQDGVININYANKSGGNKMTVFAIIVISAIMILAILFIYKNKKESDNSFQPVNKFQTNNPQPYVNLSFEKKSDSDSKQHKQDDIAFQQNYIENNGYAPGYNYTNNLDITLTGANDFSVTEYRNAVQNMQKKYNEEEEYE